MDYLSNFGGISIYRDGINIFPAEWGAVNDWLDLKTRHIKKGRNISYYNFIGNIEIDQTDNLDLVDKTDRQGLIENEAYTDLKTLTKTIILLIIENRFRSIRDRYHDLTKDIIREPKKLRNVAQQGAKIVRNIRSKYPFIEDPFELLNEIGIADERERRLINLEKSIKNLQQSLEIIDKTKEMLTEQAGFGLSIAVSIHEITKLTTNFYNGINSLIKKGGTDIEKLKSLREASSSLRTELKRLSPMRAVRSEKRIEFNILKAIKYARDVYGRRLKKHGIDIEISGSKGFQIYARYGAAIQIISNLLDNSCYWLETIEDGNRILKINITVDTVERSVIVADTGPGIHESILYDLFEPGYSLKIPPSGLGLYICKFYMHYMKGEITLTQRKDRLKEFHGAQFTLDFFDVKAYKEEQK